MKETETNGKPPAEMFRPPLDFDSFLAYMRKKLFVLEGIGLGVESERLAKVLQTWKQDAQILLKRVEAWAAEQENQ